MRPIRTKTDIEFLTDGFYVSLFPNNEQAEQIWEEIDNHFPGARVPVTIWANVRQQIKDAGYTVRKARTPKPVSQTDMAEIESLLSQLSE